MVLKDPLAVCSEGVYRESMKFYFQNENDRVVACKLTV